MMNCLWWLLILLCCGGNGSCRCCDGRDDRDKDCDCRRDERRNDRDKDCGCGREEGRNDRDNDCGCRTDRIMPPPPMPRPFSGFPGSGNTCGCEE
ncbi:MAG: hypothetical protein J6B10_00390 [Lachnospiraceae bacterium]|nr:hypothetical protein [Lachnospiraceae bacterium]